MTDSNYPACPICSNNSRFDFSGRDLMFDSYHRYDYAVCTQCDLVFQTPTPSNEEIASFYPSHYEVYDEESKQKHISKWRKSNLKVHYGYSHLKTNWLFDFICMVFTKENKQDELPYNPHATLLDIGSGNGRYLEGMKKLGWHTKGVEFNEGAVKVCKSSGLDVHHGDLFSAKFESNSIDITHLSHVIEHLPNPAQFFAEVARILKPGGIFLLKTPNSNALGRALLSVNWYANDVPRHLFIFSEKNLKVLAESHGFVVESIYTRSSPKIFLNSIDYALKNTGTPSKRIKWRRWLAKLYVLWAQHRKQGDEINMRLRKRQ